MPQESLTLLELNSLVRQVIEQSMAREYWVEAELAECRESRGHCYMELVEKDEQSNTPVARASAKCWRTTWAMVQPYFERTTGQRLHAGMKVRLKVYAQFHEAFGFSWIVTDIDATFTLGDMARRRQEIVRKLKEEGIFDLQRELELPLFCQHIAVISASNAAGYGDFVRQLEDNEYGFQFHAQLFPAVMQGERVEQSIIAALNRIYSVECRTENVEFATASESTAPESTAVANSTLYTLHSTLSTFDCVVIIRGGGSTSDLSGFDTLALAENVAQFPLPIITGIGHDRDESVLDMVSHTRVKTPTAAAAFLISHLKQTLERIENSEERILRHVQSTMEVERLRLTRLSERIPTLFSLVSTRQTALLDSTVQRLSAAIAQRLEREQTKCSMLNVQCSMAINQRLLKEQHRLELLEQRATSLDPALLLQRGYSITLHNGHAVRSAADLQPGDQIETRLSEGTIHSTVIP
ncbi:MAG: exodeoxyribonuclease VII large subunit [Prevotella sp.]|nr:exodeoxyribonuclease VII large subunit [Prevotella sp.]